MSKSREFQEFDRGMQTILRADPKAVKAAIDAEKKANAQKRKAKPSASVPASGGKG